MLCPACESDRLKTAVGPYVFKYGAEESAVRLTAMVPITTCLSCGTEFLGHEAEEGIHDSVCRHLNVLTPREITALREQYKLSRADFAAITQLGEATIGRWERGQLIQNAAYDEFLRLLTVSENFRRLRQRHSQATAGDRGAIAPVNKFRSIAPSVAISARANSFRLVKAEAAA